jgi:hypothetical protein
MAQCLLETNDAAMELSGDEGISRPFALTMFAEESVDSDAN